MAWTSPRSRTRNFVESYAWYFPSQTEPSAFPSTSPPFTNPTRFSTTFSSTNFDLAFTCWTIKPKLFSQPSYSSAFLSHQPPPTKHWSSTGSALYQWLFYCRFQHSSCPSWIPAHHQSTPTGQPSRARNVTSVARRVAEGRFHGRIILGSCSDRSRIVNDVSAVLETFL